MKKFLPILFLISVIILVLLGLGTVVAGIGALAGWCLFPWQLLFVFIGCFVVTCLINMFWNLHLEKK